MYECESTEAKALSYSANCDLLTVNYARCPLLTTRYPLPILNFELIELRVEELTKQYDLRPVLAGIGFSLHEGQTLGITGRNGSGKSTLMRILANVLERSSGSVTWFIDASPVKEERLPRHIGFVAPYLQLYTEFTAIEHLDLLSQMRGVSHDAPYASALFERFGLAERLNDPLGSFSSGMLQRVKYVLALAHHPSFLFLDEPMTNLDERGIATIRELVIEEQQDRITVIATNAPDDLSLCTHKLGLENDEL